MKLTIEWERSVNMDIREHIREGITQRLNPLEFKGLRESDVVSLREFVDVHGNEYAWDYPTEEFYEDQELKGNQLKDYYVGDLIMPKKIYSPQSRTEVDPHRVLLIQASNRGEDGIVKYKGFLLSSKATEKANRYNSRYPNNIWIKDTATILWRGRREHKEGFIRVDDVVEFDSTDLAASGVWKGHVSNKFFRFVNNCYQNYVDGKDNSHKYWLGDRVPASTRDKEISYSR